ncbi:MAG: acetate kinase [Bacillota bacterium]|jgi:acetate kinase|nr:acetate kinase [Bacillota bacterium]HHT91175.1 acetate kinase [Bacillota bacterium]
MNIFVLNCGSSSVKYKLYAMEGEKVLAEGRVERVGQENAVITHQSSGKEKVTRTMPILEHTVAIQESLNLLTHPEHGIIKSAQEIDAVGHRVVHGGESFSDSVLIDGRTKEILDSLAELAPLHNPANVIGIRAAEKLMPKTPQVAVFDTAFHSTIPPHGFLYAIPYSVYQRHKVRRYGFHGTSHKYVSQRAAELMGRKIEDLKIISCHLGNGASIAAIADGKSIDTSMGFTPLEGLMMGTRSGDIDPGAIFYIMRKEELNLHEIDSMLNKHSGLYGMAGVSDMRDIEKGIAEGDKLCKVAFDMYEYRIRKYIGSYIAAMNGVDAIVFTAGIGENTPSLRTALVANLPYLGITLDEEQNKKRGEDIEISTPDSRVRVFVIPTDEELVIARDTASIVS